MEREVHEDVLKRHLSKVGIIFGVSSTNFRPSLTDQSKTATELEMRSYVICWDLHDRIENSDASKVDRDLCCKYWNLGFACGPFMKQANKICQKHHICSNNNCRTLSDTDHRAIQHPPVPICTGHRDKLLGLNKLHEKPIQFHKLSSPEDTREACEKYNVKLPALNAELLGALLEKTEMLPALQESLVRGWREGLDLGSDLPEDDHWVNSPNMNEEQLEVLSTSLKLETNLKRLCGPLKKPICDGRWFTKSFVSPYFVIPKKTPPNQPQRWRLIHHLSFHNSGNRSLSVNGHIDIEEFPTVFPTHLTGAHLVF